MADQSAEQANMATFQNQLLRDMVRATWALIDLRCISWVPFDCVSTDLARFDTTASCSYYPHVLVLKPAASGD